MDGSRQGQEQPNLAGVQASLLSYEPVNQIVIRFYNFNCITVNIGFCNHPPSEELRLLKPARPLKQGSGYSDQVVAKARVSKSLAVKAKLFRCDM